MKSYINKVMVHLSIYAIEVFVLSKMLSSILEKDLLVGYGVYQVITFLLLSNYDSIKKDEQLAYLTFLKLAKLSNTNDSKSEKDDIEKKLSDSIRDEKQLLSPLVRRKYIQLLGKLTDTQYIDKEIIMTEHEIGLIDLSWRGSFLLRLVK